MATIMKNRANKMPEPQFDGVPYGNASKLIYRFETDSSGKLVNGNSDSAIASGDKVVLGLIPGGSVLVNASVYISDAFTALTTAKIGFEYADGVDSTDVPQDDDFFFSSADTAAKARLSMDNVDVATVRLEKDAYLILTVGGAAHASKGIADIVVDVIMHGRR